MLNEARKRSDKAFVFGDAAKLEFGESSYDAVTFITTLEFLPDYQNAIMEARRVLKPQGRLIAMVLNPLSEYFKTHAQRKGSYFRKIRHTNLLEIEDYISKFFTISTEYFLGIRGDVVFDTQDENFASLYVIKGKKK